MKTFFALPEKVLLLIISYLPESDVLRLLLVCKSLNDFISNSSEALQNVQIILKDNKADSFNIFVRKYSQIHFRLSSSEKVNNNVSMISNLGHQLRILHVDVGRNFKSSYLVKILSKCKQLKELKIINREMELDEICGLLPTTRIDRLIVCGSFNVLKVLEMCRIRKIVMCFNNEKNLIGKFDELKEFLECQKNLEALEIKHCIENLQTGILPACLKELIVNSHQPLVNYDFTKIVEAQNLKRLKTEIQADPKFLNQLSELKTLTHLELLLSRGDLKIFANLNIMQHVTSLTINNYLAEQEFLVGKFPNLKFLKFINWRDCQFLSFMSLSLGIIYGPIDLSTMESPSVLNEINFESFEIFVINTQTITQLTRGMALITKIHCRAKEIEVRLNVIVENRRTKLKLILKKGKSLSLCVKKKTLSSLIEFDEEVLIEIIYYLNYKEMLNLRLVCKIFNGLINESSEFVLKTQFEVKKENFQTFIDRKFTTLVLKEFSTCPEFNWCLELFTIVGKILVKIIFYINKKVPLMIVRNLLNLASNVKEILITESHENSHKFKGIIDVTKHPTLKLDLLQIEGNLRPLRIFLKSEIKWLVIKNSNNSHEFLDFLTSNDTKIENLAISNKNLIENYHIMKVLDVHFNLNLTSKLNSQEVEKFPLIEFIRFDYSMVESLNSLRISNLHDLSILNSFHNIEKLYLTKSTIDVSQTFPRVKRLILKSCEIINSMRDDCVENLTEDEVKILTQKLIEVNPKLEEVDAKNISMSKFLMQEMLQ